MLKSTSIILKTLILCGYLTSISTVVSSGQNMPKWEEAGTPYDDTLFSREIINNQTVYISAYVYNHKIQMAELLFPEIHKRRFVAFSYHDQKSTEKGFVQQITETDTQEDSVLLSISKVPGDEDYFYNRLHQMKIPKTESLITLFSESDIRRYFAIKAGGKPHLLYNRLVEVRLVEEVSLPAYCGYFYFKGGYIFEIMKSNFFQPSEKIMIVFNCPRGAYGDDFFVKDHLYIAHLEPSVCNANWPVREEGEINNLPCYMAYVFRPKTLKK